MVSQRPDGEQNYLFCPNAEDFDPQSPNRAAAVEQFQDCMRAGEPVVIRGLKARINWGPEVIPFAIRPLTCRHNADRCRMAAKNLLARQLATW